MNSKQEEIINSLSQISFGAPFIFFPTEYRKGNATREPADLIWACNNCIILFYMKSKEEKKGKSSEIIEGRKDKLVESNFKQAKGWLSEWRNGRNLVGENKFKKFNIGFTDYKHIIVIGVIDFGNEEGYYNYDYEKDLDVALCATLSQKTFSLLVYLDFTAVDLILLTLNLKLANVGTNPSGLLNIVKDYHENANKIAYDSAKEMLPNILPQNELLNSINQVFNAMRSTLQIPYKSENDVIYNVASIFNDIPLHEYYSLVLTLAQRIKYHEEDPRMWLNYSVELVNYIFIIGVAHVGNFHLLSEKHFEARREIEKANQQKTLVTLIFDTFSLTCTFGIIPRKAKSISELLLDNS